MKSTKPSMGLDYLVDTYWIELSGLANTWTVEQDRQWHPEGVVGNHLCASVDAVADYFNTNPPVDNAQALRLIMMFTMLLHDVGKAKTTHMKLTAAFAVSGMRRPAYHCRGVSGIHRRT